MDIACMPLKKNVPVGLPDWKLTKCPICGRECWESGVLREYKQIRTDLSATCTECALRIGLQAKQSEEREPKEPVEINRTELEILQSVLFYGFHWIAKDLNGVSYAYVEKPYKCSRDEEWTTDDDFHTPMGFEPLFGFLHWEDSEPLFIPEILEAVIIREV